MNRIPINELQMEGVVNTFAFFLKLKKNHFAFIIKYKISSATWFLILKSILLVSPKTFHFQTFSGKWEEMHPYTWKMSPFVTFVKITLSRDWGHSFHSVSKSHSCCIPGEDFADSKIILMEKSEGA